MFFDVTRAGTDRPLRVAVAAIAYLDTLPAGCVLHLVGGQGLQVAESAADVEDRAREAQLEVARTLEICRLQTLTVSGPIEVDHLGFEPGTIYDPSSGPSVPVEPAVPSLSPTDPAKELAASEPAEAPGVSSFAAVAAAISIDQPGEAASPAGDPSPPSTVEPPAAGERPAHKARRRRGQSR